MPQGFDKWLKIALVLALSCETHAVGSDLSASRLYRSPYHLGRGDTGIALTDDCEAIFYNPAAIAMGKGLYKRTCLASPFAELSLATRDLYRRIAVEEDSSVDALRGAIGRPQHFGLQNMSAIVFRRAALGVVASTQTDILVSKAKANAGLETVDARVTGAAAATFSLAESFFDQSLFVGLTGKYIPAYADAKVSISIIDAQNLGSDITSGDLLTYGSGVGADIGVLWKSDKGTRPSFGLLVENLGGTSLTSPTDGTETKPLRQTINLGAAIQPGTRFSSMKLLLDYRDATSEYETNVYKKIHIGTEITLKGWFGITFGAHQGYATAGTYLDIRLLRLDLGMYTEEAGDRVGDRPDSRYFFRLMVGI